MKNFIDDVKNLFTSPKKSSFTSHKAFTLAEGATHVETSAKKCTHAFTLAEVLITLGIIGIVASMTLPALIHKNQNKALEASLKKNYSVIQQALEMYQAETGERIKADGTVAHQALGKTLKKYFNVIKDCGYSYSGANGDLKGCIANNANTDKSSQNYKTFNGQKTINLNYFDDYQFILNDGSIILFENQGGNNSLYISVDVNGYLKNPNRLGQDLFMFQIDRNGKLLPMGVDGTYYSEEETYCNPTSTSNMNGAGCTYKALTDKNYFNTF